MPRRRGLSISDSDWIDAECRECFADLSFLESEDMSPLTRQCPYCHSRNIEIVEDRTMPQPKNTVLEKKFDMNVGDSARSNLPIVYDPSVEETQKPPHHGKMPSWEDNKKLFLTWWGQLLTGIAVSGTLVWGFILALTK